MLFTLRIHVLIFVFLVPLLSPEIQAAEHTYSSTELGYIGLNTVPSARIDRKGTVRLGLSAKDPYYHGFVGFQVAEPLYVQLRQSGEISSLDKGADRLYPGIDFKLRLLQEQEYWPEVSVGMTSAFGSKRTASEYLVASKAYKDFDFSLGLGWGRMGGAGHLKNPFKALSSHFGKERNFNSEFPNTQHDWFTGNEIGIFGGVEYFTPFDGLSLKADFGADRYLAERQTLGFETPAPWSLGFNYAPTDWADISGGTVGTDTLMARISLKNNIQNWPGRRVGSDNNVKIQDSDHKKSILGNLKSWIDDESVIITQRDENDGSLTHIVLSPDMSYGEHIRHISEHILKQSDKEQKNLTIKPVYKGVKGPTIHLIRRDVEMALAKQGSPEEIWHSVEFEHDETPKPKTLDMQYPLDIDLILDTDLSLSEEDSGFIYRTSLLLDAQKQLPLGFLMGKSFRLNLKDNLDRLQDFNPLGINPVRSDIDFYAQQRLSVDQSFASWIHSFNTDFHLAATAGYLEEMYAGYGGEFLYRPFGNNFAIGIEGWNAYKRIPGSVLNLDLDLYDDVDFTGHFNAYYEIPDSPLTFQARFGKYLAGDYGATLGLERRFKNGAKLGGFATFTNENDQDIFGGESHIYSGLQFSLPIGNIPYVPSGSHMRFDVAQLGRDSGQAVEKPISLYDITEPVSYRSTLQSWSDIVE